MPQTVRTSAHYQYQLLHHISPGLTELLERKFLSIWDPVTLEEHLRFDNILPVNQFTGNLDAPLSGHNIQLNMLKSLWQKAILAELFKIWCGSQIKVRNGQAVRRMLCSARADADIFQATVPAFNFVWGKPVIHSLHHPSGVCRLLLSVFRLKRHNFSAASLKYCNTRSSVFRHSCDEIVGATENFEIVAFFRIITHTHWTNHTSNLDVLIIALTQRFKIVFFFYFLI